MTAATASASARARATDHGAPPTRRRRGWAALAALLAGSCSPSPPSDNNLLLITVDTLRADHLGAYGYDRWGASITPAVDALAERGVTFETVYAPRGQTHPSLASMLTGKYPITHGLRENGFPLPTEHTTLFEHLEAAGYQTGVFVANIPVYDEAKGETAWVARGAGTMGDGFAGKRHLEAGRNESQFQRVWDERVEFAAIDFLEGVDTSEPFALWVHFYDVHKPYNPPPTDMDIGPRADVPPVLVAPGDQSMMALEKHLFDITFAQREPSPRELDRILGLYDGAVRATDRRIANILGRLDGIGETDSTYVMFSADHGEELYDHNRYFFHGASIHDGTVRLPLILAGPGLPAGRRVSEVTRNIDIAPTALDLLELPADPAMEGGSLAGLADGSASEGPAEFAVIEWQDLIYAVSDGRHKLIWNPQHVWTRKPPYHQVKGAGYRIECLEGYDLLADPREQHNLLDASAIDMETGAGLPEAFLGHWKELGRFRADPAHRGGFAAAATTDADLEALKQMGYLGTNAQRSDSMLLDPCVER